MRRSTVVLLAAVVLAGGCSRAVDGTPTATPGQGGFSADAALLETTCEEFVALDNRDRREVIVAIGEAGNRIVALGPDAWVDLAAALCNFVDPDARVADILEGAAR
jgi:uncharacterized lipoprotein YajG